MQIFVLNKNSKKYFEGLYDADVFPDSDENMIMLGAVENNRPIALLCATVFMKEVAVQWLFVTAPFRGKKVASNLIKALVQTVSKCGVANVYLFFTEDNKDLEGFLKATGFNIKTQPGWVNYSASLRDVLNYPQKEIDGYRLSSFLTAGNTKVERLNSNLVSGKTLVGVPLKIDPRDFSPFSCCSIVEDHISSLILVITRLVSDKDVIELPWLYVGSDSANSAPAMYNATLAALRASYDLDTEVHFSSMNEESTKFITTIVPNAKSTGIYIAYHDVKR